jgi:hypothetical protein
VLSALCRVMLFHIMLRCRTVLYVLICAVRFELCHAVPCWIMLCCSLCCVLCVLCRVTLCCVVFCCAVVL